MTLHNPFDFVSLLVVDLAGTPEVFSLLAILLVSFFLSRFNFSNKINMAFFVLAAVLMASYIGGLYALAIILVGLATFYSLSRMQR